MPIVESLLREYAAGPGIDLCLQGLKQELASRPRKMRRLKAPFAKAPGTLYFKALLDL
ncbi:MAG: hypothetical protein R2748_04120 [Bryobacterales bacterium]